jgi:hypothetical protein
MGGTGTFGCPSRRGSGLVVSWCGAEARVASLGTRDWVRDSEVDLSSHGQGVEPLGIHRTLDLGMEGAV